MTKKCGCAILVVVMILLVLVGGAFGMAWWGYGKYLEPKTGVKFFDALGLVAGLYNYDEDAIVTNPYDETTDLAAFNLAFRQAFLPNDLLTEYGIDPAEFDKNFDIKKIIAGNSLDDFDRSNLPSDFETSFLKPGETLENIVKDGSNAPMAKSLYRPKISVASVLDMDDGEVPSPESLLQVNKPDYVEISDKQLAAISQQYFANFISDSANLQSLQSTFNDVSLAELFKVAQVKVVNDGAGNAKDLEVYVTLKVDFRRLVTSVVGDNIPKTPEFTKKLLPEFFFLSLTTYPADPERVGDINANNFDDKKKANMQKMLETVTGNDLDVLLKQFNSAVSELFGSLETRYGVPVKLTKSA